MVNPGVTRVAGGAWSWDPPVMRALPTSGVHDECWWFALTPIACALSDLLPESPHVHRVRSSFGSPVPSYHTSQQWHLASLEGLGHLPHFLFCGTPLPRPLMVFPHSQPQSSPGTDLQSQSLCPQPLPECQTGCVGQYQSSVKLSLCFALFRLAAAIFSDALRFPLHLGLSPFQFECPPVCGLLSSFTAPSQECWSCSDSFFFFPFLSLSLFPFFYPVMWMFLTLFGSLRSSASIQQMFSENHSTCGFFFFFLLICRR